MSDTLQIAGRWAELLSWPAYMAIGVTIAVIAFVVRSFLRGWYGIGEIVVGLFLLAVSGQLHQGAFSSDFSSDFDISHTAIKLTTLAGAIFAMVRGFDNIEEKWWRRERQNVSRP